MLKSIKRPASLVMNRLDDADIIPETKNSVQVSSKFVKCKSNLLSNIVNNEIKILCLGWRNCKTRYCRLSWYVKLLSSKYKLGATTPRGHYITSLQQWKITNESTTRYKSFFSSLCDCQQWWWKYSFSVRYVFTTIWPLTIKYGPVK